MDTLDKAKNHLGIYTDRLPPHVEGLPNKLPESMAELKAQQKQNREIAPQLYAIIQEWQEANQA